MKTGNEQRTPNNIAKNGGRYLFKFTCCLVYFFLAAISAIAALMLFSEGKMFLALTFLIIAAISSLGYRKMHAQIGGGKQPKTKPQSTHTASSPKPYVATHRQPDEVRCPKCNSAQIAANKAGFGVGKAAIGGVLLGPVGLAGGVLGQNKIVVTCLKCGHQWKAGR